jgi:hypothetical protein
VYGGADAVYSLQGLPRDFGIGNLQAELLFKRHHQPCLRSPNGQAPNLLLATALGRRIKFRWSEEKSTNG